MGSLYVTFVSLPLCLWSLTDPTETSLFLLEPAKHAVGNDAEPDGGAEQVDNPAGMEDARGVIILTLKLGVEVLLIDFIADICDLSPGQKPMPTHHC